MNGVDVVGRYVFGAPLAWGEELMLCPMILAVPAGAVTVSWRQSHIRIEALVRCLPRSTRRAVSAGAGLVTVAMCVAVAAHGLDVVGLMHESARG